MHENSQVCLIRFEASDATLPQLDITKWYSKIFRSTQQRKTQKNPLEEPADKIDENEIIKVELFFASVLFEMGNENRIEFINFHQDVVFSLVLTADSNRYSSQKPREMNEKILKKSKAEDEKSSCKFYL